MDTNQFGCKEGYVNVVSLLLAAGADSNVKDRHGGTPISRAAEKRHVEVIKLLLKAGANSDGLADLAAREGNREVVELLKSFSIP
jgi:ankyrin repeat protein